MQKPLNTIYEKHRNKKLIVFDFDGTLIESKTSIDREMALLLTKLLGKKQIAVISGGKYELFQRHLLSKLKAPDILLKNLFLFPVSATAFYRYNHGWKRVYVKKLSQTQRSRIKKAFKEVFKEVGYKHPEKTYGKIIEDRGSQVTFSALGQDIVAVLGEEGVRLKKEWKDKNTGLKLKLAKILQKKLPDLEVRAAGYTSIDVTRKGIDKAYGLRQIKKHLGIPFSEMLFVGDALFPGGNDYAALQTGVECVSVKIIQETKKILKFLLAV